MESPSRCAALGLRSPPASFQRLPLQTFSFLLQKISPYCLMNVRSFFPRRSKRGKWRAPRRRLALCRVRESACTCISAIAVVWLVVPLRLFCVRFFCPICRLQWRWSQASRLSGRRLCSAHWWRRLLVSLAEGESAIRSTTDSSILHHSLVLRTPRQAGGCLVDLRLPRAVCRVVVCMSCLMMRRFLLLLGRTSCK